MSARRNPPPESRPLGPTLRKGSGAIGAPRPAPRRDRFLAYAVTAGVHIAAIAGLLWLHARPAPPPATPPEVPLQVSLLPTPPGPPDTADDMAAAPNIAPPPLPQAVAPVLTIASTPVSDTSDMLSQSQLAGAAHVGEGGAGGGGCDMARAVQQALRRDSLVRPAVADANRLGKASLLWNGDWVRSGGQDGKGLAAVRQAVIWEVGFAPAACRNTRMHGLVLLSLADGSTRFAIGTGDWRWSDLLGLRGTAPDR